MSDFLKRFCESLVPVVLPPEADEKRCPYCGRPWREHTGIKIAS